MNSTIVAIATPSGRGAIAVVRLSGPDAFAICQRHLTHHIQPRRACFTPFLVNGQLLDEVVVVYYAAPHSYTGEEVVEISCHGSLYIQEAILQALVDSGARLAEPGEFTRRAFLGGKLNLSQAEAVADLIDSTNAAQHSLAVSQLRGGYAQQLKTLREQLLELTSLLELELDFSQEDVEFADRGQLRRLLSTLNTQLSTLIHSFQMGNALKQGIPVAIVGEPNAGKSTLLNALLCDDRAIVSPIPGTTRDTIEAMLTLDGILFRFIDTAGLHESDNPIEKMGIERSRRAIEEATIVLVVGDTTGGVEAVELLLEEVRHKGKESFLVLNKADLMSEPFFGNKEPGSPCYWVSALQGKGIDELKQGIVSYVKRQVDNKDVLLTNMRHYEAMKKVYAALKEVDKGLEAGISADLVAIDLRDALHHLGTITGEVTPDEILGTIFSRFCVGK